MSWRRSVFKNVSKRLGPNEFFWNMSDSISTPLSKFDNWILFFHKINVLTEICLQTIGPKRNLEEANQTVFHHEIKLIFRNKQTLCWCFWCPISISWSWPMSMTFQAKSLCRIFYFLNGCLTYIFELKWRCRERRLVLCIVMLSCRWVIIVVFLSNHRQELRKVWWRNF